MPRHGWCLCCGDYVIAERYCKVTESNQLYGLKTEILLGEPLVELVLRVIPFGAHATIGARQTRTLKFALEAHVGKDR